MSAQEMSGPSSGGNPDLEIPPWVKTLQPVSDKITEIRGANWDHLTRVREIGIIFSECENFCEWLKAIKTSDGKEPTSIVLSKEYLDPDLYSALKQIDESKYQGQDLNHVIEHVTHLTDDGMYGQNSTISVD